jgi:hypothetical protein
MVMNKRTTFNQAELDRIADTIKKASASGRPSKLGHPMSSIIGAAARANTGKAFAEALTRAGVDVNAMAGKAAALEPKPGASNDRAAYKRANMAWLEAFDKLARPDLVEVIDKPFLIWEFPRPEAGVLVDSGIQPLDSFVRPHQ